MTVPGEEAPEGVPPEPAAGPAPKTGGSSGGDGGGGGAVQIGSMSGGAIATGAHGQATSYSYTAPPRPDEATLALLEAVRTLRAELRERTPDGGAVDGEAAVIDGELAEVEGEITRTGRAGAGRLVWLRDRLEASASAVGLLASATAVVQTVVQAAAQVLG